MIVFVKNNMPITSSAKKAHRSSLKKRVFNLRRKKAIDNVVKDIKKLVSEKKITEAKNLLPKAQQAIDKAFKTGLLKLNTASRKKSRLMALLKKI